MELDFEKLLEPYRNSIVTGKPERTLGAQRLFLTKKHGVPEGIADRAMQAVYLDMQAGRTFEDGHALDMALLMTAIGLWKDHHAAAAEESLKATKRAVWAIYQAREDARKPKNLLRHPLKAAGWYWPVLVSFALGAGSVGAAWLASTL